LVYVFKKEYNIDMSRKDLTEFIITLILSAIITYFAFTTNVRVFWAVAPIAWGIVLGNFSTMMLLYSAGISSQRTRPNLFVVLISPFILIINWVILYLFFKNNISLFLLFFLFAGVAMGVREIRFAFLERSGKPKTRLEEIKSFLIAELWFILLIWTLKCAQIIWSKAW